MNKATHVTDVYLPNGEGIGVYRTSGGVIFGIDASWLADQDEHGDVYYEPIDGEKFQLEETRSASEKVNSHYDLKDRPNYYYLFASYSVIKAWEDGSIEGFSKLIKSGEYAIEWKSWREVGYNPTALLRYATDYGECIEITVDEFKKLNSIYDITD